MFAGGAGCSSTSSNPGAADGAPPAVLDAGHTECEMAGGQCIAGSATCWGEEGFANCGSGAVCCKVVFDAGSCTDANAQVVLASSYDQSCMVDSDCVGVSEGNSCQPCDFSCSNATINASALAKYTSDTSHFPAVMAVAHGACPSSCGGPVGVCCLSGKCHRGSPCPFPTAAPTCALGAACSSTDVCTGGIAGCTSNCQCLDGKWTAPCPTDSPQTGSACTPEGAYCGYTTSTNTCGADTCYCKAGAWSCGPSCIIGIGDASANADTGADTGTRGATDSGPLDASGG